MRWTLILALGAVAGCASLQGSDAPDPDERFARAMEALERQDFTTAYEQLGQVYRAHWNRPVAERALLALAAVELDPRNAGRRLDVGAELAARHFQLHGSPSWTTPVSQTLYLLAQELGAAEERAARAEAERERAEAEKAEAERVAAQAEQQKENAEKERRAAQVDARRARAAARAAQAQARSAAREPRPLPRYSGPSVSARVRTLSGERDRLRDEVRALRRELAAREQELERIRSTLAPRG